MGRSQVLFNQRKGRGRGRGSGRGAGRFDETKRRISRPKWNAGKGDENQSEEQHDNSYDFEERLEDEVSLLEANVASQRYVMPTKKEDSEATTLAFSKTDPEQLRKDMNFALKHLSLADRFRIPSRLISSISGQEPDNDARDDSTTVSSLSSVTVKYRAANALADPVASRLGIHNLPARPVIPPPEVDPKTSRRVSLFGVAASVNEAAVDQLSKLPAISASHKSQGIFDKIEPPATSPANITVTEDNDDLILRLRSLPSQDQDDFPRVAIATSNGEDNIDEWLKETLNSVDTANITPVESTDKKNEILEEENLEDWLDSMI
ncbi:hypothetical protein FisN_2Lh487 [Fistulifera solaris]|uniref:Cell death regulator Aven n=1 Tax=Fistulifera solaris TaxID=1519565 RepID=A0A1Z5JAE2_FISSO|nr:hypothetical protein FisN_2Lh487 [Fistulifera solaris]|eukprot:GAX10957.1 hypothetical protein FisN_2Lh487 [Fistulifera solaris]